MKAPSRAILVLSTLLAVLGSFFASVLSQEASAARNSSGSYSLPSGNPVVTGQTITSSWANTTLTDLGTELTNSLDRNGRGAMLAPLQLQSGTAGAPGLTFSAEASSGLYRAATGDIRMSVASADVAKWTSAGLTVPATLTAGVVSTGTLAASGPSGGADAITTTGGSGATNSAGGRGVVATGGSGNGSGAGGRGLSATGGAGGSSGSNGAGLVATGGINTFATGGTGIGGFGGTPVSGSLTGGVGVVGTGGNGSGTGAGGAGGVFNGGTGTGGTGVALQTGTGGLQIGSTGTAITASYGASYNLSTNTVLAGSCNVVGSGTQTLTGAAVGGACFVSMDANHSFLVPSCNVTGANTISILVCNPTAGSLGPVTENFRVRVFQP